MAAINVLFAEQRDSMMIFLNFIWGNVQYLSNLR